MNRIEVCYINTLLPERDRESILCHIPSEYVDKAQSAGNPVLARQELAVGWLLHRVLGFGPKDMLVREPMGKPRIDGGRSHISIAHSGDWAAIAVGDCEIGVDLEVPGPVQWAAARRYFQPEGAAHFGNDSPFSAIHRFPAHVDASGGGFEAAGDGLFRGNGYGTQKWLSRHVPLEP